MKDALIISFLSILPRKGLSWTQGAFARKKASRALLRWYVSHYKVNLDEMEGGLEDYPSLAEFFVRPLKPGARSVDSAPRSVVAPCDGKAVAMGPVVDGFMELWDNRKVPVSELLGNDERFEGGDFLVIYLAPPDYHRVHTPLECQVESYRYLPGHLWPVFPAAVRSVNKLFAKNERLVIYLKSAVAGRVAEVMVGAYGVGRIETRFSELLTNAGSGAETKELEPPVSYKKGEELGRFNMGSTVILFFEKGAVQLDLELDQVLRMGQVIGHAGRD